MDPLEREIAIIVLEAEHQTAVVGRTARIGGTGCAANNSAVAGVMSGGAELMLEIIAS